MKGQKKYIFTKNGKKAILNKIVQAEEGFENTHVKFIGTKRFGLDGRVSYTGLGTNNKRGGNLGAKEIKIGIPHRGRLNVLANVMENPSKQYLVNFLVNQLVQAKILREM